MRHKTSIVIGACAVLLVAGTAGAAAWTYSKGEGRSVGTWHEAPGVVRGSATSLTRSWPGTSSFEV